MAATATQIAQLRRMCALGDDDATYSNEVLAAAIEAFPLPDSYGREPDHDGWDGTYDLNAAASRVWSEMAAALASAYDVNADGADLRRSQRFEQARKMASYYGARRAARAGRVHVAPRIPATDAALEVALLGLEDAIETEEDA